MYLCKRTSIPGDISSKEPPRQCRRCKRHKFHPWVRKIPLEEGTATHSSILAWRIPWTEEPGGLQSTKSERVGHGWSDLAHTKSKVIREDASQRRKETMWDNGLPLRSTALLGATSSHRVGASYKQLTRNMEEEARCSETQGLPPWDLWIGGHITQRWVWVSTGR